MTDKNLKAYLLPEGNVQIAFSGGRSSGYMLHQILEANGGLRAGVEVTFQNTGREANETLDFVAEVGQRWGVMITWLEYRPEAPFFEQIGYQAASRDGRPFTDLIRRKKYLPNQQARFCTIELKVRTAKRYLVSLGWKHWTNCVGFRGDEPARLNKPPPKDRWTVWHPMATANVSKQDVAAFWRDQPFDLMLENVNGKTPRGNCVDCFLKSEANIAAHMRDNPDDTWAEDQEAWMASYWNTMTPFQRLRRIVRSSPNIAADMRAAYPQGVPTSVFKSMVENSQAAGVFSKRYSRAQMRHQIDSMGDLLLSNKEYLCQADDGECFG